MAARDAGVKRFIGTSSVAVYGPVKEGVVDETWPHWNVYAYAESVIHTHAGFAIDWGGDPDDPNTTGIQNPPGHRDSMMSGSFREVGIRIATPGNVA